jgi:hypothetical protein
LRNSEFAYPCRRQAHARSATPGLPPARRGVGGTATGRWKTTTGRRCEWMPVSGSTAA